jgi:hypothetical protein
MRKSTLTILAGLLAAVLSGPVAAHGWGHPGSYRVDGWSGSATIWGSSSGHLGYSGSLSYGVGYGYAPGHIPWLHHVHGPACHHGPPRGHARHHWRGHYRGHGHGHPNKRHHRRH